MWINSKAFSYIKCTAHTSTAKLVQETSLSYSSLDVVIFSQKLIYPIVLNYLWVGPNNTVLNHDLHEEQQVSGVKELSRKYTDFIEW